MKVTQTIEQTVTRNSQSAITIALAGNPNAGKTTLLNALTGLKQKVANYPGVTVERKEGVWKSGEHLARLIDLPGLYSLDVTSIDEQIAHDVLTGKIENLQKPDAVIAVVDATNIERNLYLVTQLLEYKIPVVIALTMVDLAEKQSLEIDTAKRHGAKVVFVIANNAAWNIERLDQQMNFGGRIVGTELAWSDYAGMARAFGLHAERVTDPARLKGALEEAFASAPALLDVVVTRDALSSDLGKGLSFVPTYQALSAWDDAERARRR